MSGKTNFLFIIFHIYIITYLIVTVMGSGDQVMQFMHILCPVIVIPFLYRIIKLAVYTAPSGINNKEEEGYEPL